MLKQKLLIEQTDRKLTPFFKLKAVTVPSNGWINTIRLALKMSLRQLGKRLNISSQSVKEIEERESTGSITLKNLKEVGQALNLRFVYGFIPLDGSIEMMIEKRAIEIARDIVNRTSNTMLLEDQKVSEKRIEKAIRERADEIKNKLPKYLWD